MSSAINDKYVKDMIDAALQKERERIAGKIEYALDVMGREVDPPTVDLLNYIAGMILTGK